jgi:hypothetical protein
MHGINLNVVESYMSRWLGWVLVSSSNLFGDTFTGFGVGRRVRFSLALV